MLYIKASHDDYAFFSNLKEKYTDDIILLSSRNFDGSSELVEIFIELTPSILLALTTIIHEIVSYMNNKNKYAQKTPDSQSSEIIIEKKENNNQFKIVVKSSDIHEVEENVQKILNIIKNDTEQN